MEGELEKYTHSLDKAKGKLSGYGKKANKENLLAGEIRGYKWLKYGRTVNQQKTLTS